MNIQRRTYDFLRFENQLWGLIFGLIVSLAFITGLWGWDAFLLARAGSSFPWLKLLLGSLVCLPLSLLAGWLTGRFDSALIGLAAWLCVAVPLLWIAGRLPYEGVSFAIGLLDPPYRDLAIYPFGPSAQARIWIVIFASGALCVLGGVLQTFLIQSARASASRVRGTLSLLISVPFFLGSGLLTDNLIQRPLRQPLVVIENLIQFAVQNKGKPVDPSVARQMHLSALRNLGDLVYQPHRLVLGSYDIDNLESARVYVDFGGTWVRCYVIVEQPSFCQRSDEYYGEPFTCLWKDQGQDTSSCSMRLEEPTRQWLAETDLSGSAPPTVKVFSQRGLVTFVSVLEPGGGDYTCRLREERGLLLEACQPSSDSFATPVAQPAKTQALTSAVSTSLPVLADQEAALLPSARSDLATMGDLSRYILRVDIEPQQHSFVGQVHLDYTNTENVTLPELNFRLFPNGGKSYGNGSLTVSKVTVDGQPVQPELRLANSVLRIALPSALPVGGQAQIAMDFAGQIPLDFGGESTPEGYGIYNSTDGVIALSGWYPILAVYDAEGWNLDPVSGIGDAVYSDMAFYTVEITLPADDVLAATGVQEDRQEAGGKVRYRYVSGPARDFFIVTSPDFKVKSETALGTKINSYYLPKEEAGGVKALEVAVDSLQAFTDYFGAYPYTELDIVDAPMRNAGGVEFPGIVLIESSRYGQPENPTFIVTVSHEVAHQWWYNLVGNDVIDEPWLDEALATYSSAAYYDYMGGRIAYDQLKSYWQDRYDQLLQQGKDAPVAKGLAYFAVPENSALYGPVVYTKGALFLDAVRQAIGDDAFYKALQNYYRSYRYRIAETSDLLKAFQAASDQDLGALYQKWLYSPSK